MLLAGLTPQARRMVEGRALVSTPTLIAWLRGKPVRPLIAQAITGALESLGFVWTPVAPETHPRPPGPPGLLEGSQGYWLAKPGAIPAWVTQVINYPCAECGFVRCMCEKKRLKVGQFGKKVRYAR